MTEPTSTPAIGNDASLDTSPEANAVANTAINAESNTEPKPSYVKLAMRNMVRKGSKSLFHFGLTTAALLGLLVGLAYLTR